MCVGVQKLKQFLCCKYIPSASATLIVKLAVESTCECSPHEFNHSSYGFVSDGP